MARQFKNTAWSSRPRRVMVLLGVLVTLAALSFGVMSAFAATGPTVSSFTLVGASPTNAASVSWKVVFSSSVTGVAASNFTLQPSGGVSGAGSVSVSGSGATYTVSASTGSGSGTLGLKLSSAGSIKDSTNHGLQGAPYTGPVYTIDKTAPTVLPINRAAGAKNPTNAGPLVWTVTFSEPVTGVVAADFGLVKSGIFGTAPSVTSVSPAGPASVYTVTVSMAGATGADGGSIGLNLISKGTIEDAAGNGLAGSLPVAGQSYGFDTEAPPPPGISSEPPLTTTSTSATFAFADDSDNDGDSGQGDSDDVDGAVLWCSLDSATAFTVCTSPVTYTGLSQGPHTFRVYAVDLAGNVSTTSSYTWTVRVLAAPTIATALSAGTTPVGSGVYDTASLSGETANAGGTVTYTVYPTSSACTSKSGGTAEGTETVTSGSVPHSGTFTPTSPGSYYWQAVYSGDSNNAGASSGCSSEPLTVNKAATGITTTPSAGVPVGGNVSDRASLNGSYNPTGSIVFTLYSNSACSTQVFTSTNPISSGSATSGSYLAAAVGTYYWKAYYAGDSNNTGFTTACGTGQETVAVGKASPTISTTPSAGVTVGGVVSDKASLTGSYSPTGSITFTLYSNSACSTQVFTSTNALSGTSATSGSYPTTAAGTYYWKASYAGDANNTPFTTPCGTSGETVTVGKASPTISTSATGSVTVGGTVSDTAALTGLVHPDGTGMVVFALFSNSGCTGTPLFASFSPGVSGNGNYGSGNYTTTAAAPSGDYWAAIYAGDSNNNPVIEGCGGTGETSTVNKATPAISTTLSAASINVGATAYDSSTLTGLVNSTGAGTVTYTYYTNNTCTLNPVPAGTKTVPTSGPVPHSNTMTFNTAGTFYWQAVYSGDANNNSTPSPCTASNNEQLTVGSSAGTPYAISGTVSALLYPGAAPQPLNLNFSSTNVGNGGSGVNGTQVSNLTVTILSVAGGSNLPYACTAADFKIVQYSGTYPFYVPNGSSSLSTIFPSMPTSQYPSLQMINRQDTVPGNGTGNQDGCEGAVVTLHYQGTP
jgi:hypothetical protein